ncbi:DASS family sodium-coupled anion symporter [Peptococcus simiae]|uniref:DASS family sodium-coupled anion symporter n=1 Tax=Peptococcus simiae TaxID=1643805 RepID=A0ABW9H0P5_9FIRM
MKSIRFKRLGLAALICLGIALVPTPAGVTPEGWRAFAFFVGFVLACLFSAGGIGELALILIGSLLLTGAMPLETLLTGFANPAVWLVLFAFFAAIGFRNTSLGYRLAYLLIARFGHHPIGLVYAISACDFIIAPFVPNTNARGAGILYPVTKALAEAMGSSPEQGTEKKIGAFLFMASFQLNLIIGALFLTAMSTNPLATEMLGKSFNISITWTDWFVYAAVPILLTLLVTPWLIYFLNRPRMTREERRIAPDFARQELAKMGRISRKEGIMTAIFLVMIVLWAVGAKINLHATIVALVGVVALLLTEIISYQDVVREQKAWDILLWLAPLIAITAHLNESGVIGWIVGVVQRPLVGQSPLLVYIALVLAYYYVHYFLTSLFVHLQAFFLPFVGILVAMGFDATVVGMVFALLTCVSPGTTHYGTGTASIYYAAGYMGQKEWWKTGFFVSVVEIIFIAGLGYGWISIMVS